MEIQSIWGLEMRRDAFPVILLAMVLTFAGLVEFVPIGDSMETRFTPTLPSVISSDTEISSDYILDNTTIESGATLTLLPGAVIHGKYDSHLYVEGDLVVNGTLAEMVQFRRWSASPSWGGITVNLTGSASMENFTMQDVKGRVISLENSRSSLIKNGYINGGDYGIFVQESRESHDIHDLFLEDQGNFGMVFGLSEVPMIVRNILINDSTSGAVGIEGCGNLTFSNITTNNPGIYHVYLISSKRITFIDFDFKGASTPVSVGVLFSGTMNDITFNGGTISDVEYGVITSFLGSSFVNIRNVKFKDDVVYTVMGDSPDLSGNLRMFECDLDGALELFALNSPNPTMTVDLFNCTYDDSLIWNISGKAGVTVWYELDVSVLDGNLNPLDANLQIWRPPLIKLVDLDRENGKFENIAVRSKRVNETEERDYHHDVIFESNEHPGNRYTIYNWNIEGPAYIDVVLDLKPTNDMPGRLDLNEDEWLEYDLKPHFFDPESKPMEFTLETGPDLTATIEGENHTLKVTNEEMDWFGVSWVNISASDIGDNTTFANVTINVLPVNDAPRLMSPLPDLEVPEDGNTTLDLSEYVYDVENDTIFLEFATVRNCDLVLLESNLTIIPDPDWFGTLMIPLNFTDTMDVFSDTMEVVVMPVNDPPMGKLMKGGQPLDSFEWNHTDHGNITVYKVSIEEDTPVEFRINATDVDDENLTYSYKTEDLENGVVTNAKEEVTMPDNTTEMVDIPYRFVYTPDKDSFAGDLVRFNLTDGEAELIFWVSFNVTPVNDPPVLEPENGGILTVDRSQNLTINLSEWASDVDDDELAFRVEPDQYLSIQGNSLIIDFKGTYTGTEYDATLYVNDGETEVSHPINITVEGPLPQPEISVSSVEIEAEKDGWYINIYAEEGQSIFILIYDSEGEFESYQPEYEEDRYRIFIPDENAGEGNKIIITDEAGGEEILPEFTTDLPELKEDSQPRDYTVYIILAALLLVILIVVLLLITRKRKDEFYEE